MSTFRIKDLHPSYNLNMAELSEDRVKEILKIIEETELPPAPHMPPGKEPKEPAKSGEKSAYTDRGSLQAFGEDLDGQSKEDALYWTLFGQLAADAQFDRQTQVEDWYKLYVKTLGQLGMSAGGYNWASVTGSQLKASVDQTVLSLIAAFVTPAELALITEVIKALASGGANKPLDLFNNEASNSKDGNFQVSTGTTDKYLNLTINIGYFYFNTSQDITNMLFWKWTSTSVAFTKGNSSLTLARSLADRIRGPLSTRLGHRITKNIEEIPLA